MLHNAYVLLHVEINFFTSSMLYNAYGLLHVETGLWNSQIFSQLLTFPKKCQNPRNPVTENAPTKVRLHQLYSQRKLLSVLTLAVSRVISVHSWADMIYHHK